MNKHAGMDRPPKTGIAFKSLLEATKKLEFAREPSEDTIRQVTFTASHYIYI